MQILISLVFHQIIVIFRLYKDNQMFYLEIINVFRHTVNFKIEFLKFMTEDTFIFYPWILNIKLFFMHAHASI